jgi:hypothetical protein
MSKSTRRCLMAAFGGTISFVLLLLMSLTRLAFAAEGGIPGPPPPPPAPCISTALLLGVQTSATQNSTLFACTVRNAGVHAHHVTIDLRDETNVSRGSPLVQQLPSGDSATGLAFGVVPAVGLFGLACVVTTDEGTTDALNDLKVVLQASDSVTRATEGETEGTILSSCALSSGIAP